jgi:hypothetical protein
VRTGRAHPRATVFPARPPGMSRRDLIGMKCRLRITVARRRAVAVVAGIRSISRSAAVLMASLPQTAASTSSTPFSRCPGCKGGTVAAKDSLMCCRVTLLKMSLPTVLLGSSQTTGKPPVSVYVDEAGVVTSSRAFPQSAPRPPSGRAFPKPLKSFYWERFIFAPRRHGNGRWYSLHGCFGSARGPNRRLAN